MAAVTFDSIFSGDPALIFSALYGAVLVKDYSSTNNYANYSPFDAATGNLSSTITGSDGFQDLGYLDDNGVIMTPKYTTRDTMAFQTRATLRKDITQDTEDAVFTPIGTTPLVDSLRNSTALAGMPAIGAPGYSVTKSKYPNVAFRSLLFIGVDNALAANTYKVKLYPRCQLVKPDVQTMNAKTPLTNKLTYEPLFDKVAGFPFKEWIDGPGWRTLGPIPAAPGTPTATAVAGRMANLSFAPSTGGTPPYTYTAASTPSAGVTFTYGGTLAAPTAVANGLTVGTAYTFTVYATDSAGKVSPVSGVSNSVTAVT